MILHNAQGKPVELGDEVGRGGEAVVYRITGQAKSLAKIYDPEPRANYPAKLAWMVEHPPDNPTATLEHASMAWPESLLYDSKHRLKGYYMAYIDKAVPLLDVFSPRRRALVLPQFDRRYLHRTARNLAAALSALHRSGYVAGDVNESNVLVTPAALVTLIDTDSFQVREKRGENEILYPCPVGKPEYTPPELQGKPLDEIKRVSDHDSFGLAVLIFQLLMGGSHPFRAQWLGEGDPPPLEKRIADGDFPYSQLHSLPIAPPPNVPDLETLHPWLSELMRRCFIDGHRSPRWRPSPELWARAIDVAEAALVCCAEGHFYGSHLPSCPYCVPILKKPVSFPARRVERVRQPAQTGRFGSPAVPQPAQVKAARPVGAPTTAQAVVKTAPAPKTVPSGMPARGGFTAPFGGWPAAAVAAATGGGAVPAPNRIPVSSGSRIGSVGVLRSRPLIQPGAARNWLRQWISSSFLIGGGQGAAAGMVPGIFIALLCWSGGVPLNWSLLLSLGGAAGGLLRGWRPGYRLASLVGQYIGWKRFWEGVGLVSGAVGGAMVGLLMAWAVIPVILGLVLGARIGIYLGAKIWQLGNGLGWERIWGAISALGAAGLGWGAARLTGWIGLDVFGAQLVAGLEPFMSDFSFTSAMIWLMAGGMSGALFGGIAGLLVDLGGRLTRLTR
jgi:hypothetical protein